MLVGDANRLELMKVAWEHNLPRKSLGPILMSKIFQQILWKEISFEMKRLHKQNKELNETKYENLLLSEEKQWEISCNNHKLNRKKFNKIVTKNLFFLVHARKHFGVYLKLDQ